ncbi:MAG: hypothetical protein WAX29_06055, partial [Propionibacterium sp.]
AAWILIATGLTMLVYPISYDFLVRDWSIGDSVMRLPATLLLVARNLAVLVVLAQVIAWTWSFLGPKALRAARRHHDGQGAL